MGIFDKFNLSTEENNEQPQLNERQEILATQMLEKKCQAAAELADDPGALRSTLDASKNWLGRFAAKFMPNAYESFTTVFRMLDAAVNGEYQLDKTTLASLVGALLYCVSPIDVIPDAIPVIGLIDDAFVLSWTINRLANEIQSFRAWERLSATKCALTSYLPYFNQIKRVVLCPGWMTANDTGEEIAQILAPVFPRADFEFFNWNSNVSWSQARQSADAEVAQDFEEFLRRSSDLTSVAVFGHSLGARILTRTLAHLACEPQKRALLWNRKSSAQVGQAFLLGAAIDADDPDVPFAATASQAPICNFFSRSDRVLNYLYRVAEQKSALGYSGIATHAENFIDCVVSGKEEYLLDVTENLTSLMTIFRSPVLLAQFTTVDNIASGLPLYWRHQFEQYAQFFADSVGAKASD